MAKASLDQIATSIQMLGYKVNLIMAIGGAVIAGGTYAVWDLSSRQGDMNRAIGVAQGQDGAQGKSVKEQLEKIDGTLQQLLAAKTVPSMKEDRTPEKKVQITPTPDRFEGWSGVLAPTKQDLEKALPAVPDGKSPVWVYTPDKEAAEELRKLLPQAQ